MIPQLLCRPPAVKDADVGSTEDAVMAPTCDEQGSSHEGAAGGQRKELWNPYQADAGSSFFFFRILF